MKLQVALDTDFGNALQILKAVHAYIDIVEIGTPLIFREGLSIVGKVKADYPGLTVLADLKIVDAGNYEATIAFQAGADIVTVLGIAADETILGVLEAARSFHKQVMVDMLQIGDVLERSRWLIHHGCDYICVHLAHDLQSGSETPLSSLSDLRKQLPEAPLAVAGGVQLSMIGELGPMRPEIIVVGKAITNAENPGRIARTMKEMILS